jgi:sporulation protein YlmC with PRC-barrel domain
MLRSADGLRGYELQGLDGSAGKVDDLYFDDSTWRIRYLVANTGGWLSGRRVLLSPLAITGVPKEQGQIQLAVTTDQIRTSPDVDTTRPLSSERERDLLQHYGWRSSGAAQPPDRSGSDLRSLRDVAGYQISTADGTLGHVEDLIFDDDNWNVRHLVVDTAPLWFGKKVLVAPEWVSHVDWMRRQVEVGFTEDEIKAAPEWDGTLPLDPDYDRALFIHYGQTTLVI